MPGAEPRQPTGATPLSLHCPAKLNLTLAVGPPRADGLHPIASVMAALDYGDTLTITPIVAGPSRFVRAFANDAPVRRQVIDWPIEHDLAFRAHALVEHEAGRPLPIACGLAKRIPAGAGLGGGSSNAAAVLVGLRDLFALRIADGRLIALGLSLGADVGFLVHAQLGRSAAMVAGIGEAITPLPTMPPLHAVLVFPEGVCPTGAVYHAYDKLSPTPAAPGIRHPLIATTPAWPEPFNDLAAAAITVCPALGDAIERLGAAGLTAHVTGSGSAAFITADSRDMAAAAADQARSLGLRAIVTATRPGAPV